MGNCVGRQAVHPTDSLEPTGSKEFRLILCHDRLVLRPLHFGIEKRVGVQFRRRRFQRLDVPSFLKRLRQVQEVVGDGRIVSLDFREFLQVPSLADLRELLPAARHVRQVVVFPGNLDDTEAKWENYTALVQLAQGFEDLQEFMAIVPKDFDWTLLDKDVFQNLRKLEIAAIRDDVPMRSAKRRMLEERILTFCADPSIFYAGETISARFLGWDFGTLFIRRLTRAIGKSKVNVNVLIQGCGQAAVRTTNGFVPTKKYGGRRRRARTNGGKCSISLARDVVKIVRVRAW